MRTSRIACLAVASCLTMQGCGGTAFTLPPVSNQEALLAAHEVDIDSSLPQFPRTRAYYLEAISRIERKLSERVARSACARSRRTAASISSMSMTTR
jgi:hypothetical protein